MNLPYDAGELKHHWKRKWDEDRFHHREQTEGSIYKKLRCSWFSLLHYSHFKYKWLQFQEFCDSLCWQFWNLSWTVGLSNFQAEHSDSALMNPNYGSLKQFQVLQRTCYTMSGKRWTISMMYAELLMVLTVTTFPLMCKINLRCMNKTLQITPSYLFSFLSYRCLKSWYSFC
jgi:hypothetical protein